MLIFSLLYSNFLTHSIPGGGFARQRTAAQLQGELQGGLQVQVALQGPTATPWQPLFQIALDCSGPDSSASNPSKLMQDSCVGQYTSNMAIPHCQVSNNAQGFTNFILFRGLLPWSPSVSSSSCYSPGQSYCWVHKKSSLSKHHVEKEVNSWSVIGFQPSC